MEHGATCLIRMLVDFAVEHRILEREDARFALNRLLDIMRMDAPEGDCPPADLPESITPILDALSTIAVSRGIIEDTADVRDRFSSRLAGAVMNDPASVRAAFEKLYSDHGPDAATDWFYSICGKGNYIKLNEIARNVRFFEPSPCGELEITINLSKPEKDPRDIAAALEAPSLTYPACMLCAENSGYAGRAGYPPRFNHRMIPLILGGEKWYFQYSPYSYYNEHCIVLSSEHRRMRLSADTFVRMFDFAQQFPHYFIGSNADLPIVGGSILSHDHFQGGRYSFPMDRAAPEARFSAPDSGIDACVTDWPMSHIRLEGADRESLTAACVNILEAWRGYSDESLGIFGHTGDTPHNTLTPILRRHDASKWRVDLVLRNNIVSAEHPLGVFHPHAELHNIKKENIGLIEVMGLFILPGRLMGELDLMAGYLAGDEAAGHDPRLDFHREWLKAVSKELGGRSPSLEGAREALRRAVAATCYRVLSDAGVFKPDAPGRAGFMRFMVHAGYRQK